LLDWWDAVGQIIWSWQTTPLLVSMLARIWSLSYQIWDPCLLHPGPTLILATQLQGDPHDHALLLSSSNMGISLTHYMEDHRACTNLGSAPSYYSSTLCDHVDMKEVEKRAEPGKTARTVIGKRLIVEEDGESIKMIAKGLAENITELPPFVSSRVTCLFSSRLRMARPWRTWSRRKERLGMDGEEETPDMGMITLPGGHILVAKTDPGETKKGRLTEH